MSAPSFDPGFSTTALTEVFSSRETVGAILEFEAALAVALGEAGLAPQEEAEAVASACRGGVTDPDEILASAWERGTPLLLLRELLIAALPDPRAGQWFHYGATSQDAIDSGRALQAKRALAELEVLLKEVANPLSALADAHRDLPQMGRTFLQDARPTTFGLRTAMWLDAVTGHVEELRRHRESLVVQLGGPVGTLDGYGAASGEVLASVAKSLGLGIPDVTWHSDRTRIVALAQALERCARSMSQVATDIAVLASSPIAEVRVRPGGSSAMPEKRNPVDSIRAVAAASGCSGAVSMLTGAPPQLLDRGLGAWHVEWLAVPLAFQNTGAAIEAVGAAVGSLEVDEDRMRAVAGADFSVPEAVDEQIERVLNRYRRLVLG